MKLLAPKLLLLRKTRSPVAIGARLPEVSITRLAPMTTLRSYKATRPGGWRLARIIWPFVATVLLLLMLGYASLTVISAIRAYVGAESHWSKAQKSAVLHLEQYGQTRNEDDYSRYVAAINVNLSDRKARIELEKPRPDLNIVRHALVAGRNHPDDVDDMINLFRRLRNVDFMAKAIAIWAEADTHIADLDKVAQALHAAIGAGTRDPAEIRSFMLQVRAIDERLTPLETSFSATMGAASRQTGLLLTFANLLVAVALALIAVLRTRHLVRQGEAFESALRTSEERFDYAISGSNDGIWDWNSQSDEIYFSSRFEELLGYAAGGMRETTASFLRRIHPFDRKSVVPRLREHLERGDAFDMEFRLRMHEGDYRWFSARGRSVRGAQGEPQRMAGSLTDISDRKQAEAQVFDEKERAQVTLASIADAVITVDTNGRVEYLNPIAERLTGWRQEDARRSPLQQVFSIVDESTGGEVADPVARTLRDGCTVTSEGNIVLRRRNDAPIAIDHSVAPIRDRSGSTVGAVLAFHDMSRERQYAARLAHLASHDALTGLLNRREFEHRLNLALVQGQHHNVNHAVLYLDLDQFKVVNDTCGHAAGDELLRQVSALLRPRLREGDTLARLGGDEFGVLLEHCAAIPALRIADSLRKTLADFHFVWKTRSFNVGVSIGLVNIADGPQTLAQILSAADSACYVAKDKGRNRVQVYSPESDEHTLRHGEMEWVNRIHRALEENRFSLYAQPIHATQASADAPPYTELLLRLRDENNELVPPMAFIPAAERYHLMPAIDRWVISTAFGVLARQFEDKDDAGTTGTYAINLSGASIGDEEFLDFVREQFVRSRIPHSYICFEITETTAVTSLSKATDFIVALRGLGCRFALDDFGVGVSSLTYLKHLPIDYLKIDGSFVKDMLDDPVDYAMVEAIHRIANIMGKKTIAESVESRATLGALRTIGVDYAQGFAIAAPAPFGVLRAVRAKPPRKVAVA